MTNSLILGGARSGKSAYAESTLKSWCRADRLGQLHYVATAIPFDDEMKIRIARHQALRGEEWLEHESPMQLPETLAQFGPHDFVLVDCLTVWLNNVIYNGGQPIAHNAIMERIRALVDAIEQSLATIFCVSNEVGMGVIPMGEQTRMFVDHAGWMNQHIAAIAEHVVLVVSGLPMGLKGAL